MKKKDIAALDNLTNVLETALKRIEHLRRGGSVPPAYTMTTNTTGASTNYDISYLGFHPEFVGVPAAEPEDAGVNSDLPPYEPPGPVFVSIGKQVQDAREKLEEEGVFAIPESVDNLDEWAEEAAAYVARFYGQPVERVHVELFKRPLAEMREATVAQTYGVAATHIRNMRFETEDNLTLLLAVRDQIAALVVKGAV